MAALFLFLVSSDRDDAANFPAKGRIENTCSGSDEVEWYVTRDWIERYNYLYHGLVRCSQPLHCTTILASEFRLMHEFSTGAYTIDVLYVLRSRIA